ncbi:T9SS type A sorting domain-containing protein [Jejudonia soesokkakensis]|uniref:T9SS type A sorting domain-containing protein n=1 Tax=Jejudonia soesokkakensis TaxID=1323432 RepID=A0ABW2MXH4_9FLAO
MSLKNYFPLLLLLCISSFTHIKAQERIAVIQDPLVVLLDPSDGSIVDPSFIDLSPLSPSTPKGILQVIDKIWITDQIADRIDIFDLDGNFISTIDVGLDNIKGLAVVNNSEVWVTNAGSGNSAPGEALIRFDLDGNNLGFYPTSGTSSAFDIIDVGGEVYISYIGSESKIERRDYNGNVLGNIVEEGVVQFIQQIELNETENTVYASVFSSSGGNPNGFYEFSITDGTIVNSYEFSNLRGVAALEDGNVLISSSAGVEILDPSDGSTTNLSMDASQFFGRLNLTPCTAPAAPSGDAVQNLAEGSTLEDIVITPMDVTWYATEADALAGVNPLPLTTVLEDGESYFAVNFEGGCPSEPFEVTINIILGLTDVKFTPIVLYPNPARDIVTVQHPEIINKISVINKLGQVVFEKRYTTQVVSLDVTGLAVASYILRIDFDTHSQSVTLIKSE